MILKVFCSHLLLLFAKKLVRGYRINNSNHKVAMNFFLILSRILVGKADINSQKKSHFNLSSLNPIQPEAKTSLRCCVVQSSDKISTFHISFKQVRNFNIPGMMPLVERCVEGQNFIIYDRMTVQLKETRCTKLCCTAVLPYHYTLTHQGSQNQKL